MNAKHSEDKKIKVTEHIQISQFYYTLVSYKINMII